MPTNHNINVPTVQSALHSTRACCTTAFCMLQSVSRVLFAAAVVRADRCGIGPRWSKSCLLTCWPAHPLASQAVQEVESLRQAVASAEHDRAALASAKARLGTREKQCRVLEWENEVLTQRLEVVSGVVDCQLLFA
jgi:hypothetical protein